MTSIFTQHFYLTLASLRTTSIAREHLTSAIQVDARSALDDHEPRIMHTADARAKSRVSLGVQVESRTWHEA